MRSKKVQSLAGCELATLPIQWIKCKIETKTLFPLSSGLIVRYGKCYFQDLKNSWASLLSHHIAAEGCKNKGFRHFLAKKSISNCLAWMKTRCSIPSSFCSLFFILFFILSHLGSDYMVIFFCLAQSHVKMLQFKPNRRLLAQFVEQIY